MSLWEFNPFIVLFIGGAALIAVGIAAFHIARWIYRTERLSFLNDEYKFISHTDMDPKIKAARLSDIDDEAKKLEQLLGE